MDIPRQDGKVGVLINQDTFISALIEMAASVAATVVIASVGDIEVTHEFGEVAQGCFHQEMEVVGHEDITVELNGINSEGMGEVFEKPPSVEIVSKNSLLFVPPAGDVIHGTGILNAKGPRHKDLIEQERLLCQQ